MSNLIDLTRVNSTSYADVAGLYVGLSRLPAERTPDYLDRLQLAVAGDRAHPYPGVLNEINLALGLRPQVMIEVTLHDPTAILTSTLNGLVIAGAAGAMNSPLVTIDEDNVWKWRYLSNVISDIEQSGLASTRLLVEDGLAMQLARQSNMESVLGEAVTGMTYRLARDRVIVGSEVFNQIVPPYSLSSDGQLVFASPLPAGLTISYRHLLSPYDVVGAPGVLLSLSDPAVQAAATGIHSVPVYQVREAIQTIMQVDRSYWAR